MLKKLSLAALVAMGSMSFAGATDLSSAIQGVQLNGFLRLRAYWHNDDATAAGGTSDSYRRWRTNAKLVFGVPVAENTKIVWRVHAQTDLYDQTTNDYSNGTKYVVDSKNGGTKEVPNTKTSKSGLSDSLFFVNYKKDGLAANVGVIPLGFLPYASSDPYTTANGAGADATYTIGDVTLAAGYVDHLFNANDTTSVLKTNVKALYHGQDVYTLGAIYKNKDLGSAQLWYATIADLLDYDIVFMSDIKVPGTGFGVRLDYAESSLSNSTIDDHIYYNAAVTAKVAGISAIAGYAGTNDKAGVVNTSGDSKLGTVPTELRNNVANMTDIDDVYFQVGYDVTKAANVYVAYNYISQDLGYNQGGSSSEYEVGAKYKVNKKFGISAYYDILDMDSESKDNPDQQEARLQFLYSF